MTLEQILAVYNGSSGEATRELYARLGAMPPRGPIAMNLMRACKASERAKVYSRRFAGAAYDKKDWSIAELCRAMVAGDDAVPCWGWGRDERAINFENVLYINVPGSGQVSFHTALRRDGPDYPGGWDGAKGTAVLRICRWVEAVLDGRDLTTEGERDGSRDDRREAAAAPRPGEEQAGEAERCPEGQKAFDL